MARHAVRAPEIEAYRTGAELEHAEADQLLADAGLQLVRQDEGGRWHPQVAHAFDRRVQVLVGVPRDHQPKCRLQRAAEQALGGLMANEAGSLDGLAAARQDLCRLAHAAIHLSSGMAALRGSAASVDARSAEALAGRLRRRPRKALVAYARAALRTKAAKGRLIVRAREASLAEIGRRGAAEAERLADVEAGADPALTLIKQGVTKALLDLALEWRRHEPEAD